MADYIGLKKSNCKNCYKCIRHCPVKSIRFSGNQAHIVSDECVLCGQCFVVCPQNAKVIRNDLERAQQIIMDNPVVIASLAPSFVSNFDGMTVSSMEAALKQLGFSAVEETAVGATIVKKQYDALVDEGKQDIIISSCCHSVNLLIQKYFPDALPYLARIMSPMQAHCQDIKSRFPDAKTVFIGPCISKKQEAELENSPVDCVLTFEELSEWMEQAGVTPQPAEDHNDNSRARWFPTTGGILKSMDCRSEDYAYLAVDGMDNCIHALQDIIAGNLSHCFIEMSSCAGSCIGGPAMAKTSRSPVRDYQRVSRYAGKQDFPVSDVPREKLAKDHPYLRSDKRLPGEAEIREILRKMGKTKPEDELNCGSCGYDSCREKAIAVYQGKADMSMCLPFLKDRAETFSDTIIKNTPNGIIVLNEALEIQQINDAALHMMNLRHASDVLGEQVIRILDPTAFFEVMDKKRDVHDRRVFLAEYQKYVEQSILYDRSYHVLICILRDITEAQEEHDKKERMSRDTIEITDKVIEKQMRVVQEIASLLGETTAETKIALTKLKESLSDE